MPSTAATRTLAIASLVDVAGCGGPSEQERRTKRASYERSVTPICTDIRATVTPRREPAGPAALKRYAKRADKAIHEDGRRLHDLRAKLGDSAPSAVTEFDERIDAVLDASRKLDVATQRLPYTPLTQQHADSVSAPAERARRAFAALNRAAQTARLKGCLRGGNRLADTILLALYRDRLGSINHVSRRGYRRLPPVDSRPASRARYERSVLRIDIADLRRTSRLHPPSTLRALHARQQRLDAALIRLERRVVQALAFPTPQNELKVRELIKRLLRRGTTVLKRMERIAGVTL